MLPRGRDPCDRRQVDPKSERSGRRLERAETIRGQILETLNAVRIPGLNREPPRCLPGDAHEAGIVSARLARRVERRARVRVARVEAPAVVRIPGEERRSSEDVSALE